MQPGEIKIQDKNETYTGHKGRLGGWVLIAIFIITTFMQYIPKPPSLEMHMMSTISATVPMIPLKFTLGKQQGY